MRDRGRLTDRAGGAPFVLAALCLGLLPTGAWLRPALGVGLVAAAGSFPATRTAVDPAPPVAAPDTLDPVARLAYGVEYADDPQISPDGRRMAYVHRFADEVTDGWHAEIVLARSDGGGHRPLTSGPDDGTPRFSPDGSRLAYVSLTDGFHELRVLSLATRRRLDLAAGARPIGTVAWAPTGDRIAFLRHGSNLDTRVHLYVADVSSGAVRRLTSTGFPIAALALDTRLAWTPDGSALLFSADPDLREAAGEDQRADTGILEIASSGGSVRRLTSRPGREDDPTVSPDGGRVAFVAIESDPEGASGSGRLLILERSGGAPPRPLYGREGLDVRRPVWSPDGRQIFALLGDGRGARLGLIELDGSLRVLADGLGAGTPTGAGSPSFTVSADSANPRFVATAVPPGSPGELVVGGRRPGDVARRVTWINEDLDLEADVASGEMVIAGDHPARILAPPDAEGPLPAILAIHGDCGSGVAAGFDLELTALAAAGHVVLALDPPGDVDLALAAIDSLIARPGVSTDRLALLERSGDGTLARGTLERSDIVRAAAVHRPTGCGEAPDAERPALPAATADPSDEAGTAGSPPLLVIESPAHPFDEPPSALVSRLRRTLDWLRGPEPR